MSRAVVKTSGWVKRRRNKEGRTDTTGGLFSCAAFHVSKPTSGVVRTIDDASGKKPLAKERTCFFAFLKSVGRASGVLDKTVVVEPRGNALVTGVVSAVFLKTPRPRHEYAFRSRIRCQSSGAPRRGTVYAQRGIGVTLQEASAPAHRPSR